MSSLAGGTHAYDYVLSCRNSFIYNVMAGNWLFWLSYWKVSSKRFGQKNTEHNYRADDAMILVPGR
jgi:hypothetical protein